jgi:hypothetical protein
MVVIVASGQFMNNELSILLCTHTEPQSSVLSGYNSDDGVWKVSAQTDCKTANHVQKVFD